jgi:polar amino acid transport system substrate-binding protein
MAVFRAEWRCFHRIGALLLAFGLQSITGCEAPAPPDETTLDRILREGVVRIGYANEAPYAYLDRRSARLTGEAPEIAQEIFRRMGVERVEGVLTEFGSLIPGLKAGRFDLIAAGMYVLPKRCREIAFSRPTYRIGEAFLVKAGNPMKLHAYADAATHPGARVGVVAGSVELAYARGSGIPDDRLFVLPDVPSAVAALQAGRIDAYAGTSLTVRDMLNKANDPGLERATPFEGPVVRGETRSGYGAFGIRKEDRSLLEAVNEGLEAFIGSAAHLDLVKPFGFDTQALPGDVSTESLCAG